MNLPAGGTTSRRETAARGDALPQAAHLRRSLSTTGRRRQSCPDDQPRRGSGGHRGASQESSAAGFKPAHRRFGSATPRTRTNDATRGEERPEETATQVWLGTVHWTRARQVRRPPVHSRRGRQGLPEASAWSTQYASLLLRGLPRSDAAARPKYRGPPCAPGTPAPSWRSSDVATEPAPIPSCTMADAMSGWMPTMTVSAPRSPGHLGDAAQLDERSAAADRAVSTASAATAAKGSSASRDGRGPPCSAACRAGGTLSSLSPFTGQARCQLSEGWVKSAEASCSGTAGADRRTRAG